MTFLIVDTRMITRRLSAQTEGAELLEELREQFSDETVSHVLDCLDEFTCNIDSAQLRVECRECPFATQPDFGTPIHTDIKRALEWLLLNTKRSTQLAQALGRQIIMYPAIDGEGGLILRAIT